VHSTVTNHIMSIIIIIIIIIIIERRDFGVMYFIVRAAFVHIKLMMMMMIMSNDCKNTLQTQNSTSAMQENKQNIYQIQTAAELSESGKLRANSSIFS